MEQALAQLRSWFVFHSRSVALTSVFLLVIAIPTARWILATLRPRDFPPGPPITPGLGNLLQVPLVKPYLRFQQWSKSHTESKHDKPQKSEMIGLKLATANMVVLQSARVVHELLDKRGDKYSDRTDIWIVDNHILHKPEEKGRLIMNNTEPFRKWRRSWQHVLAGKSIKKLLPLLEAEAAEFCRSLATASRDEQEFINSKGNNTLFTTCVRRWALAPPLLMTSGQRLRDRPDSWVSNFYRAQDSLIAMILPGNAPPVDLVPILRYIPEFLAPWKTQAREARRLFLNDAYEHFNTGRMHLARVRDQPSRTFAGMDCLMGKALREREDKTSDKRPEHETDQYIAFQNSGFLGAAADTVVATLNTLVLVLAAFPEVGAKAREEVDRVCGDGGGPPTAEKLGEFVYLRACMTEALRWRPTTPGALPHVLSQDDTFEGYVFPKGTSFVIDAWTIGHDEELYDRPEDFMPERFLDNPLGVRPDVYPFFSSSAPSSETAGEQEPLGAKEYRRPVYAFGAGRRQCPGEQWAYTYIMLTLAKLVWALDFAPAAEGAVDLSIETGFVDGVVTRPASIPIKLRVRSEERKEAVVVDAERTREIADSLME